MKEFLVLTKDNNLGQLLRLLLRNEGSISVMQTSRIDKSYDCIIADIDTVDAPEATIKLSRNSVSGSLPIPFAHEELLGKIKALDINTDCLLRLSDDKKTAKLKGKSFSLTEVEGKLLFALTSADGFVSRDSLLKSVWCAQNDSGVVNVYIHYLREKLEKDGEKIIISSRKYGYKIDEKYKGGTIC